MRGTLEVALELLLPPRLTPVALTDDTAMALKADADDLDLLNLN